MIKAMVAVSTAPRDGRCIESSARGRTAIGYAASHRRVCGGGVRLIVSVYVSMCFADRGNDER